MRNNRVSCMLFLFVFFCNYVLSNEVYLRRLEKEHEESMMKKKNVEKKVMHKAEHVHAENMNRKEAELIYKARFMNDIKGAMVSKKGAKTGPSDCIVTTLRRATQLFQQKLDELAASLGSIWNRQQRVVEEQPDETNKTDLAGHCNEKSDKSGKSGKSDKSEQSDSTESEKEGNEEGEKLSRVEDGKKESDEKNNEDNEDLFPLPEKLLSIDGKHDIFDEVKENDSQILKTVDETKYLNEVQRSFEDLKQKVEGLLKNFEMLADRKLSDLNEEDKEDLTNLQKEIQVLLNLVRESLEYDLNALLGFLKKLDNSLEDVTVRDFPRAILHTITELVQSIQQGAITE